jgi:arylsulfatase A-like enzyme
MPAVKPAHSLIRTLTLLTLLWVGAQFAFLYIHAVTSSMVDTFISSSITRDVLHMPIFLHGLLVFVGAQLLVYALLTWFIWYTAAALKQLFNCSSLTVFLLGILLWAAGVITILAANAYYVPHSFFAEVATRNWFGLQPDAQTFFNCLRAGIILFSITSALVLLNLISSINRGTHLLRHGLMLLFIAGIAGLCVFQKINSLPVQHTSATAEKPNIIFIGLDALRPDYVSYYNKLGPQTPHLDNFLENSIHFSNATTTLARTFPSWSSIFTGTYPLHNHVRGNNTDLSVVDVTETLGKQLQKSGYETVFSTDDTRFNNTTEIFGFDHIITPPMGLNDFLFASLNDFPLSNLLIPTPIGAWLFPFNYANHGTAITYTPQSYLQLLARQLHQRTDKPLFMAVHFTISHWPFYTFNDKQNPGSVELDRYKVSVAAADRQFQEFMTLLAANGLLDHTIVVVLSDHGITLGLPGDRPVTAANYQGNPANIKKLSVVRYAGGADLKKNNNGFAIDTSYGYGGDVLSMKQFKTLLAFRGYGVNIGAAHEVMERVSMLDIAPTLLTLLKMPLLRNGDGISLEPYLFSAEPVTAQPRTFFLETSFTINEIERENISVDKVLQKALAYYQVDPLTGLISVKADAEKSMNRVKQFGILQGDWLYVQYPLTRGLHFAHNTFESYVAPAYEVLVNLKTGIWTTELNTPFALASPARKLKLQLEAFYGAELYLPKTS